MPAHAPVRRLVEEASKRSADVWIVNSCTVKSPSQSAMSTTMQQGKALGKRVLVTGCVPQGDRKAPELQEFSLLGMLCGSLLSYRADPALGFWLVLLE